MAGNSKEYNSLYWKAHKKRLLRKRRDWYDQNRNSQILRTRISQLKREGKADQATALQNAFNEAKAIIREKGLVGAERDKFVRDYALEHVPGAPKPMRDLRKRPKRRTRNKITGAQVGTIGGDNGAPVSGTSPNGASAGSKELGSPTSSNES